MTLDINALLTLFLVYLRIVSFLLMVPVFGKEFMPNTFKVFLATAIGFSLFLYSDIKPLQFPTTAHFLLAMLKEILFGFTAGLMLRFLFDAMQMAGEFISLNMGLGLATIFNPQQPQTTVFAFFLSLMATLFFLALGGAEITLLSLGRSFERVPPGGFSLYEINPEVFLSFFYESFLLAFKVSLPVIVVMLVFNLVLALVNRFIPQINVFIVGLPIQVFIGFVILLLSFPVVFLVYSSHVREYIIKFVALIGGH
ncbi:MAG: flagellar biosynthetic protein FliR [Aquificaceae bacterium]|jgi:flagellar biosynthetic protein FliR|uniref:flagellar biosynthetic protein FliR n=1 Tax=Hydrogenobacter sp. Uz 6-8 TaxID=3384828 RepID=UPI0030ABAE78